MERLVSLAGLFLFLGIGWALSDGRKHISWRLVLWGVSLQFIFALLILKTAPGHLVFDFARVVTMRVLDFADYGSKFLFGNLATDYTIGATVAFKVLPVIIFTSSLMGVLTHLNIIQQVIRLMALIMQRTMRASGAEALMSAMFVFMGIEATTGVKDYIRKMTRSELFTVMTGFLSTIAGSVMAVYVSFGASAGHLLAASVMSAPAAIVISKLIIPERDTPETSAGVSASLKGDDVNVIEAAANGAYEGMKLAVTVAAMLLAFIALIGMLNSLLGYAGTSFESLAGYAFTPVAFVMGVPWEDCSKVGELLGIKVVFTEFIAYQKMQALIAAKTLHPRSITIATYALCSFANLSTIAMLIGGIGSIAPERKKEVASMAVRALVAGVIASFMTATIAGLLV
ncbi:MAG TPA: nucleoside transporter C-terminal domain-containing protein [Thermodesulfobacteriota bacterium]|nr:nucleoside transporter C-terminal domain-containing protein [Thermodesulfobacteriota bacterium]